MSDVLEAAGLALEAGDDASAQALLEAIPEESRDYQPALRLRAGLLCKAGEHFQAIRLLRKAIAFGPDAPLWYQVGECWDHLNDNEECERAFRKASELDPAFTDSFIRHGVALEKLGKLEGARTAFERAIANDHKALVARYHLAHLCAKLGDPKRALAQLHLLQGLKPDYPPTYRKQAEIFLTLGDHRQALVTLCWLVQQGHADAWCFSKMGRSYRAIGDPVQALKAFEFALRLDPELTEETAFAAQLNEELEQFESAYLLFKTLESDPSWGPRVASALARLEKRLAIATLIDKDAPELQDFAGFEAPPVTEASGTLPLRTRASHTTPIPDPTPSESKLLARLRRNLVDMAYEVTRGRVDIDEWLARLPLDEWRQRTESARKRVAPALYRIRPLILRLKKAIAAPSTPLGGNPTGVFNKEKTKTKRKPNEQIRIKES